MKDSIAISAIDGRIIAEGDDYVHLINDVVRNQDELKVDVVEDHIQFIRSNQRIISYSRAHISWIFMNNWTHEYIVIPEKEITDDVRWKLEMNGYELYSDNVLTQNVKSYMQAMEPRSKPLKYVVKPVSFKDAKEYIERYHRHHKAPQGHKFSIGLYDSNGTLIGVVIAGRPVSRHLDNGETLEVTRCCVLEGFKNAVSKLYSAVMNAAKALGYSKVITYTLATESGISMRAAGFECEIVSAGGSWSSPTRQRIDKHPLLPKYRWSKFIK